MHLSRCHFSIRQATCLAATLLLSLATDLLADNPNSAANSAVADYSQHIKPLLTARCYRCHGAAKQEGRLRLDTAASARAGGENGPALQPGMADASLLLKRISAADDAERMPPEGERLKPDEIRRLREWINSGAAAPADESPQKDPRTHWAFQNPARPAVPKNNAPNSELGNPIDAFLRHQQAERGLTSLPPAAKTVWLRRVFVDLIGLPPTAEDLREFAADDAADAEVRMVERLLNDPRHGERWARHWMDVWRYSDWDGYGAEVRESKQHIWRWRDWIIDSVNADKSYNNMIVEMLAGDEVAPDDADTLRATGFLARQWFRFNRNVWLDNAIEHTGKAFLGLTFNCAKCHEHMYDPLSQAEYYQLRAFFEPYDLRIDRVPGESDREKNGLVRAFDAKAAEPTFLFVRGNEAQPDKSKPLPPALPALFKSSASIQPVAMPPRAIYPGLLSFIQDEERTKARNSVTKAEQDLTTARAKLAEAKPEETDAARLAQQLAELWLNAANLRVAAVEAIIAADAAEFGGQLADGKTRQDIARAAAKADREHALAMAEFNVLDAEMNLAKAKTNLKPGDAKLQKAVTDAEANLTKQKPAREAAAKALEQPAEQYSRLSEIHGATSTGRRLALANWIASSANPLTARVAVNHIWMRHFGSPLVASVFDFGNNGKPPTHPELLDWLAVEFMESGWSMKHLHRLIVTSQAYRVASGISETVPSTPQSALRKPQAIDPENILLWRFNPRRLEAEAVRDATLQAAGSLENRLYGADIDPNLGMTNGRRSIYFRISKEKRMTFTSLFDAPNVNDCYRRDETVAPQQALAMANSGLTLAQSRLLAGRLADRVRASLGADGAARLDSADGQSAFVAFAFEQLLNRPPTAAETDECARFLSEQAQTYADRSKLKPFAVRASASVPPSANAAQRARENLIHVLFNHHDFVTVR